MAIYLIESKADQQKLIDHVGENTAKLFFSMKDRLKSPENDIYYWLKKDPEELIDRLSDLQNTKTRSQKEEEASKGAELVYNKDGWKVYHIATYEASAKYGKNTQWCITGSKRWSNGERGEEYFNQYVKSGVEFYFYIKDGTEKYALAITPQNGNYQVFNAKDDDISKVNVSFLPDVEGLPKFSQTKPLLSDKGVYFYNGGFIPPEIRPMIKKVSFSQGITSIRFAAFRGCENLTEITIPDSVVEIGKAAFFDCSSLESIHLPNRLKIIPADTFYSCYALKSIEIPYSVVNIEEAAFEDCVSLGEIILPPHIKIISDNVFKGCQSLYGVYYAGSLEQWRMVYVGSNPGLIICLESTGEVVYDDDEEQDKLDNAFIELDEEEGELDQFIDEINANYEDEEERDTFFRNNV